MNKLLTKNTLLVIGAIFLLAVIFFNSQQSVKKNMKNTNEKANGSKQIITLVNPEEFAKLSQDPESFVLDVHTPEQTHISGTDAFIPYDQIPQNVNKLPKDKSTPILVYCRSGSMSRKASETLSSLGYINIYDLEGGIKAYKEWNVAVDITPKTQELGTVIYGDIVKTTFKLTNFTPAPLTITRISTSCGCTSASAQNKKLGAYETTDINVSFNPAVHKDDTDLGELTRTIYIETDNPNFPKVTAEIAANVVKN